MLSWAQWFGKSTLASVKKRGHEVTDGSVDFDGMDCLIWMQDRREKDYSCFSVSS